MNDFKDSECPACASQAKFFPEEGSWVAEFYSAKKKMQYIAKINFCDRCGLLYAYSLVKEKCQTSDTQKLNS